MSKSQRHTPESDSDGQPALGSRENWWGRDPHETQPGGHVECQGTDPADFVAQQLALQLVDPICGETGGDLTDPILYVPKQREIAPGQYLEYGQHPHRRRYNKATGFINWGETTTTAVPEFDYDIFRKAVDTYLAMREHRLTDREDYLEYAEQVWCDPSMGSKDSLEQFIRHVRSEESNRGIPIDAFFHPR
jgi:hypothetical protein